MGQGDEVPTAPVTVAVSLADKLDSLVGFFLIKELPTGSRDPFGLRRAALGIIRLIVENGLRLASGKVSRKAEAEHMMTDLLRHMEVFHGLGQQEFDDRNLHIEYEDSLRKLYYADKVIDITPWTDRSSIYTEVDWDVSVAEAVTDFFADRLKVQQREAGVRHDLIDAVFALGGEDDLVRLLARVKALQALVETPEGGDLLAGYKRAANILKKEGWGPSPSRGEGQASVASQGEGTDSPSPAAADAAIPSPLQGEGQNKNKSLPYPPEIEETALIAALDSAEPKARAAVEAEDFEGAMAALATLRAPVDAFFDKVTVNDPDPAKREARLALLARMRDAVHRVADFSRIEG